MWFSHSPSQRPAILVLSVLIPFSQVMWFSLRQDDVPEDDVCVLIPFSQVMWFSLPLFYLVLYVPVTPPFSAIDGLCFANAFVKERHVMYLVHDTTS